MKVIKHGLKYIDMRQHHLCYIVSGVPIIGRLLSWWVGRRVIKCI